MSVKALVVAAVSRIASEGNPGRDLRTVQDHVENEILVLEVGAKGPITDLSKDGTGEVDTDYALDLPHQVRTDSKSSDLAAYGRVNRFIKIISATQSHIRIEPVIVSRDSLAQALVQAKCQLLAISRLGRINGSSTACPASDAPRLSASIRARKAASFSWIKCSNPLRNVFFNAPSQRTDRNVWSTLVAFQGVAVVDRG